MIEGREGTMTIKGKDLIERIKDKEYSEDLIKELEKYEVEKPKSVWELKEGDEIWLTYRAGFTGDYFSRVAGWWDREIQIRRRELGLVHLTKERAELHARVLDTELAIRKWKRENDNVEFDWSDGGQYKYHLACCAKTLRMLDVKWGTVKFANTIYFSSESFARQCINDIGEERIIEWIRWEESDQ